LIVKLRHFGITGTLTSLSEHYLTNRSQRVLLNGKTSIYISWVLQGSIFGTLLFLFIYANDVKYNIISIIKLFADDIVLIKEIDNPVNDFRELNNDIEALNSWSKKWLITFNAEKTKYLISSRKPKKCTHSSLIPDSVSIKQVLRYKHLGLIFSDKMTWSDHIDDSCKRSNKHLDVIAKMRYILPRLCIEKLHNSFVCSMLDYSDVIYYNCSNIDSTKIENIQRWACIILMGVVRETRYKTPLKEAGVEPLKTHRKLHRLTYLFKIKKIN
jgi:hypothetical protein